MRRVSVHIAWAATGAQTAEEALRDRALLQSSERERASRFLVDADRDTYVLAHALLRRALSRHEPVLPDAWRFTGEEGERPEIAAPLVRPPLRFSLSHARGFGACAIARDVDIGFDVEPVAREAPFEVAERFAPSERADLASLAPDARRDRFFAYWTLKEAYIKARGLGLALPLDGFAFSFDSPAPRVSFGAGCADDERAWRFATWIVEGVYRVAVAVRTGADLAIDVSPA